MRFQEGAIETFYYYLWLQNDSIKQNKVEFHLPDTIIYRLGMIQAWYFTKESEIVVKKLENRTISNIETAFLKDCEHDICAFFISCKPKKQFYNTSETRGEFLQDQLNVDCKTSILYLNKEQFIQFIRNPNVLRNGILQKFTIPSIQSENVIQAIWSQNMLLLSQRINNRSLDQMKFDVQEKCATFNSSELFSTAYPVKSKALTNQIQRLINYVATRISVVTYEKFTVNRAVIYCKLDQKQRLNILYCTSLRTNYDSPFPMQFGQLYRPENVKNAVTTNTQKPKKLIMNIHCLTCQSYCQEEDLYPVKYQCFITEGQHHRMDLKPYSTGVKRADRQKTDDNPENHIANTTKLIPDIFKKLYPHLNHAEYAEMCKEDGFLNKELLVCVSCYLKFTTAKQITRLSKHKNNHSQPKIKHQKNRSITDMIREASAEITLKHTDRSHSRGLLTCLTQRNSLISCAETTQRSTNKSSRASSIIKNNIILRNVGRKSSM